MTGMVPQQLACPKCGCLLARFDTEVRCECPNCEQLFTAETPPVWPSTAPKTDPVDSIPAGCGMLIFLFLLSGIVPLNLLASPMIPVGCLVLLIGLYSYLTHVRDWSATRAVTALTAVLFLLLVTVMIGQIVNAVLGTRILVPLTG